MTQEDKRLSLVNGAIQILTDNIPHPFFFFRKQIIGYF